MSSSSSSGHPSSDEDGDSTNRVVLDSEDGDGDDENEDDEDYFESSSSSSQSPLKKARAYLHQQQHPEDPTAYEDFLAGKHFSLTGGNNRQTYQVNSEELYRTDLGGVVVYDS
jgi:hypothetical protein